MRIAITAPTAWPYVQRGGERFVDRLAQHLAANGHEVTLITSKPGRHSVVEQASWRTIYHRQLWHPCMARIGLLQFHAFFLHCFPALLGGRYDVVHCCTFLDTYAAVLARRVTGTPCVFWVHSLPPPVQYFRSLTLGGRVFRRAMRDADEVVSLSGYMQAELEKAYGRCVSSIPPGVDLSEFPLNEHPRSSPPTILCTAALDDERKGGKLLFRTFNRLKRMVPEAVLQIAGPVSVGCRQRLLELVAPEHRESIVFIEAPPERLPDLYGSASVTVLPSMWEAFGLVLVESLATGTPVVGTASGAIPGIINDPAIGRTFDPGPLAGAEPSNEEGFAEALTAALELGRDPATPGRCRARAMEFSWSSVGPAFEEVYYGVAASIRRSSHGYQPQP
jgi:phosphatidyl-myo-inositol alpha-mannosyltransferase